MSNSKISHNWLNPTNKYWVVILNHENFQNPKDEKRPQSAKDVTKLIDTLKKFQCNIIVYKDLEAKEINKLPSKLVHLKNLSDMDGLLIFILSHGGVNSKILASDSVMYNLYAFLDKFNSTNFDVFANKPIIFFIGPCRGGQPQSYERVDLKNIPDNVSPSAENYKINKNVVISFATMDNALSYRPEGGTLYIESLCDVLEGIWKNSDKPGEEISKILVKSANFMCQKELVDQKQLSQFYSSLSAPFYLMKSQK